MVRMAPLVSVDHLVGMAQLVHRALPVLRAKPGPPAPWAQTDCLASVARPDVTVLLEPVVLMVLLV